MAIFGEILRLAFCIFSKPPAARFIPASYIRTKATPCVEMWEASNLRQLKLGEENRQKKPQGKNIMPASATPSGHNKYIR